MHYGVAEDVDAAPPGASGELGVLAGREVDVSFAVEFDEFFQDDGAGGHVDAEGEGFGGEDDFEEAVDEEFFDDVAEGGEHAGVVGGEAAGEGSAPVAVAEDFEVFFRDGGDVGVDDVFDAVGFFWGGEVDAGAEALGEGAVASDAGEDEGDGWQHVVGCEDGGDFGSAEGSVVEFWWLCGVVGVGAAGAEGGVVVLVGVFEFVDVGGELVVEGGGVGFEEWVEGGAYEHPLVEWDGSVVGDDDVGVAADGGEPVAEFFGVADCCGESDDFDGVVEAKDDFFPDAAAGFVGEVVDFVHDDVGEAVEGG